MIIFAVGVNDSLYRKTVDNPETSPTDFEENLNKLVIMARKFTKKILFVGLIKGLDAQTMPLLRSTTGKIYSKTRVAEYDRLIAKVASENEVIFVDVNSKLIDSDFDDGLHPNVSGQKKLFKEISKSISDLLDLQANKKVLVVDKFDKIITAKTRPALKQADILRVAALWIENENGEILLVRRSMTKMRDAGKWGPASAKILEKGQSYEQAISKAMQNELSLSSTTLPIKKYKEIFISGEYNFFCHWYLAKIDSEFLQIKLNKVEASEFKWIKKEDLKVDVKNYSVKYTQSFAQYLDLLC